MRRQTSEGQTSDGGASRVEAAIITGSHPRQTGRRRPAMREIDEQRRGLRGPLIVQMHGEPGSGKSAVARELGRRMGAVVLDKDVIKAALLRSGVMDPTAGMASYEVLFDVAMTTVRQGYSVVIDSPVYWPMVEAGSRRVADECGAAYAMVACVCEDRDELARRLADRNALPSQPRAPYDLAGTPGAIEPSCGRLVIDTTRPLDEIVEEALAYVWGGVAA